MVRRSIAQEVIKEVRVEVPKIVHVPVEVVKEVPIEIIHYIDKEVRNMPRSFSCFYPCSTRTSIRANVCRAGR